MLGSLAFGDQIFQQLLFLFQKISRLGAPLLVPLLLHRGGVHGWMAIRPAFCQPQSCIFAMSVEIRFSNDGKARMFHAYDSKNKRHKVYHHLISIHQSSTTITNITHQDCMVSKSPTCLVAENDRRSHCMSVVQHSTSERRRSCYQCLLGCI